jgi:aminoglycoside/choline kinase family phosphotransferase
MDLDKGLLLVEDLGDRAFGKELASGRTTQAELWRAAVDALIRLRSLPLPASLPLPDGASYTLPRRDRAAFEIEIELLLDWYWPEIKGSPAPASVRAEFEALWTPVIDRLLALPGGWFLRDYHSPNLMWLPERDGIKKVGLLDFQDAVMGPAPYDLVSLLQDARVDVPDPMEIALLGRYVKARLDADRDFATTGFVQLYVTLGAQRATKILGIFARLDKRDGKPQYLRHLPRIWRYLRRCLMHPTLVDIKAWYDTNVPKPE